MTQEFATRMKTYREEAGLSIEGLTFLVRDYLPEQLWVSTGTIHRLENGRITEDKAATQHPHLMAALAEVYGVELAELSKPAAEMLDTIRKLVRRGYRWMCEFAASFALPQVTY